MLWFKTLEPEPGIDALSKEIILALRTGKKVLWFVCGGSNVPAAVKAMDIIRERADENILPNLTVAQTDERYGPIGHKHSNWRQMMDTGFTADKINVIPMLVGKSLEATVSDHADQIETALKETSRTGGLVIALFGIGADGHIAGILPGSPALADPRYVSGYEASQFTRITLTPPAIRKIHSAYLLAFGPAKKYSLTNLRDRVKKIDREPSQLLKELSLVRVYSDQL